MADTDRMREDCREWLGFDPDDPLPVTTWEAWQAACRAQAKRDAEICESLRHMPAYTRTDGLQITRSADARECAEAIKEGAGL